MPPLAELTKPTWLVARWVGMLTLRFYLVIAVVLMVIKIIQLAIGHELVRSLCPLFNSQDIMIASLWLEWKVEVQ